MGETLGALGVTVQSYQRITEKTSSPPVIEIRRRHRKSDLPCLATFALSLPASFILFLSFSSQTPNHFRISKIDEAYLQTDGSESDKTIFSEFRSIRFTF